MLRKETVGGALLLLSTVLALLWANSPWSDSYAGLRDTVVGPRALHLDLSLGQWAADGLLAIFFFTAGLELKREFVAGDLRDPRRALVPVVAAVGGMALPALLYTLVNLSSQDGALTGWAIPTATDIAFAVAVLAVISTHLPTALRTFLLTLAVVDDLLAITIIAVFYTSDLAVAPLLGALTVIAVFGVLVQRRVHAGRLLIPVAVIAWALMHASGIHATVAGVLLGFTVPVTVPVTSSKAAGGFEAGPGPAEHFEHLWRPVSAGIAVPVFAFLSAGVTVGGLSGLATSLQDRVALGIVVGLVAGKALGILGTTAVVSRFTRVRLDPSLSWWDVLGASLLGGIGFTVSLLIGELAFGAGSERDEHVKVGVLTGSLLAATSATVVLRLRDRTYRRLQAAEQVDADADGVPDAHRSSPLSR
ncbi:Na+/H+ antiporter NhaA [Paenibacillus sp. TRM 82003]|nr:Na+/H+ antiporter NhaA [Kineococcus sp. TRM81007]MCI2237935.1 Na+/H+ antiporter NhaA [Kineococcus sp. TRM81007]MCI3925949.1 Na+/H+ antiporter NhaA [Paenibacillus sp. TRM 82003]